LDYSQLTNLERVYSKERRMLWFTTLVFVVLMTAQNVVGAQQQTQKKVPLTLEEAVDTCIFIVRKETDDRIGFKVSQFDAYTKPGGKVMSFGTPKERFSFVKCMNAKGHSIDPIPGTLITE
jgi:hypothetical protein